MRLLDAQSLIYDGVAELVEFTDERSAPPYAILSHTWETEEVLFADIPLGPDHEIKPSGASLRAARRRDAGQRTVVTPHVKAGWNKIFNACLLACQDELDYIWIDTCCIDKSSSAELSEAINSMYRWYEQSSICYAYLADCVLCPELVGRQQRAAIPKGGDFQPMSQWGFDENTKEVDRVSFNERMRRQLRKSRWFTRGWTLQELIAPDHVHFFDLHWQFIATKSEMPNELETVTGIHRPILRKIWYLESFSVAQRMSWASRRETTRIEDEAYCLLGIFGINIPLLYGEGHNAFQRLQEEIIRTTADDSILAWEHLPHAIAYKNPYNMEPSGLLALSPAYFWYHAHDIESDDNEASEPMNSVGHWIDCKLSMTCWQYEQNLWTGLVVLRCRIRIPAAYNRGRESSIGIQLRRPGKAWNLSANDSNTTHVVSSIKQTSSGQKRVHYRQRLVELIKPHSTVSLSVSILKKNSKLGPGRLGEDHGSCILKFKSLATCGYGIHHVYPECQWNPLSQTMALPIINGTLHGALLLEALLPSLTTTEQVFAKSKNDLPNLIVLFQIGNCLSRAPGPRRVTGNCQHWIFPATLVSTNAHAGVLLEKLCKKADSFFARDYFEDDTLRHECNKSVPLDNSNMLHVRVHEPTVGFVKLHRHIGDRSRPRMEIIFDFETSRLDESMAAPLFNVKLGSVPEQVRFERIKGQETRGNKGTNPSVQKWWHFSDRSYGGRHLRFFEAAIKPDGSVPTPPQEWNDD